MSTIIGPIILGVLILIIGILNTRGNISSLHWYHRYRVTEENKIVFGKIVGIGTIIIGISMILLGVLSFVTEFFKNDFLILISSIIIVVSITIGIVLNFYAMIKYNKGIF